MINVLARDMLRLMGLPSDLTKDSLLLPEAGAPSPVEAESDSDTEDEAEEDEQDAEGKPAKALGKRKTPLSTKAGKKRTRGTNAVLEMRAYRRLLGGAWVSLLSLPLSEGMHKLVLRHLPEHVIPNMSRPLLLADYLTQSYGLGGVLAVLSLESLFQLVAGHNLDYPRFFTSLYKLCSIEVFTAKYRGKFMKLLSTALRSSNLPAYVAAAFIKRLMHLALEVPTYTAQFCVAQVFRLLQSHPQCLNLVHRNHDDDAAALAGYNPYEDTNLEDCHATQSSLWEAEALLTHYHHSIADLAHKFKAKVSKSADIRKTVFANPEEFTALNFPDMISDELNALKRNEALGFLKPTKLIPEGTLVDKCFSWTQ